MSIHENSINIMDNSCLVLIEFKIPTGKTVIKKEDLIRVKNISLGDEDTLLDLGSKFVSPKIFAPFNKLKRRLERQLYCIGARFGKGYLLSRKVLESHFSVIQSIIAEVDIEKNNFLNEYESKVAEWAAKHPSWSEIIFDAAPSRSEMESRIDLNILITGITPPIPTGSFNNEIAEKMQSQVENQLAGLSGKIIKEISEMAREKLEGTFEGKTECQSKSLSIFKAIQKKLKSLVFVDSNFKSISAKIQEVLDTMPDEKTIRNHHFFSLLGLLTILSNPKQLEAFAVSDTDPVDEIVTLVPEAHFDDPFPAEDKEITTQKAKKSKTADVQHEHSEDKKGTDNDESIDSLIVSEVEVDDLIMAE